MVFLLNLEGLHEKKEERKKNGAHNHLITPKKLRHQNIHVMLSYAKISQRNLQTQANHRY